MHFACLALSWWILLHQTFWMVHGTVSESWKGVAKRSLFGRSRIVPKGVANSIRVLWKRNYTNSWGSDLFVLKCMKVLKFAGIFINWVLFNLHIWIEFVDECLELCAQSCCHICNLKFEHCWMRWLSIFCFGMICKFFCIRWYTKIRLYTWLEVVIFFMFPSCRWISLACRVMLKLEGSWGSYTLFGALLLFSWSFLTRPCEEWLFFFFLVTDEVQMLSFDFSLDYLIFAC